LGFVNLKFDTNRRDYKAQLICDGFEHLFVNVAHIFVKWLAEWRHSDLTIWDNNELWVLLAHQATLFVFYYKVLDGLRQTILILNLTTLLLELDFNTPGSVFR
jgi:hypothetical protein